MTDNDAPRRVDLAQAIASLRAELSRARKDSEGQDIRFDVDNIEVELSVDFGVELETHGGFKLFSFVDLGGKVSGSDKTGHKVKLSLSVHPDGKDSEPFRISGEGPAPEFKTDN